MFHILVAEDEPKLAKQLGRLFQESPDFEADVVTCVEEGLDRLDEAARTGRPYDAGVLDFMLPTTTGGPDDVVDESLCRRISATNREALVVHITAQLTNEDDIYNDPDDEINPNRATIIRHLARFHSRGESAPGDIVCKNGVTWPQRLLQKLRTFLYSRHVEKQFEELFGDCGTMHAHSGSSGYRSGGRSGDLTYRIQDMKDDIANHWHDLEEPLKTRIQSIFEIDTATSPIRINSF